MWILLGSKYYYQKNYQFKIAITHKNTNIYVKYPFSLKEKITGHTSNNFTIIKSIIIILMYASQLKKKSLIFLYSHTHKLSFSKAVILFLFFLHYMAPTFFSLCDTSFFFLFLFYFFFSTPHACLLYIKACPHTHQLGIGISVHHVQYFARN